MLVLTFLKDDLKNYFYIQGIWREWADDVQFRDLDAGYYVAEELPEETYHELFTFFVT